jgi:ribosomal protein L40E
MTELTDSFCERCGTRYEFSANPQKGISLKSARVLAKGLKNFVLNDNQSLGDSMAIAKREDDHSNSGRITEAFHKTFNFCMTCRQYACEQCWNFQVGACLTCAPASAASAVAPESHLIVRTPVARRTTEWPAPQGGLDWLTEGDASIGRPGWPGPLQVEPASPSQATPFDQVSWAEPTPPIPQETTQRPNPAAAWPTADNLTPSAPEAASGGKAARGHAKTDGKEAWSLWPVTDELAPEMTLTAEELSLIAANLLHPDAPDEIGREPVPSMPWVPQSTLAEDAARASHERSVDKAPAQPPPPSWEPEVPPGPRYQATNSQMSPPRVSPRPAFGEAATGQGAGDNARTPRPSAPSRREPTPVLPVQPAPPLPPRHEPVEPSAIVARLLGRVSGTADATRQGPVRMEQWPHPTLWTDRPLGPRPEWPANAAEPMYPDPEPAPMPAPMPAEQVTPPVPQTAPPGPPDRVRIAAAKWTAAIVDNMPDDPDQSSTAPWSGSTPEQYPEIRHAAQTAPPPAAALPPVPAARTPVDRQAEEPKQREAHPQPEPPQPASWQPLGAQWPTREPASDHWEAPSDSIPAAIVAQQSSAPVEAEMWAQSSQEVLNRGTVRVCHRCALPVSTQARFCRRCGTQQS